MDISSAAERSEGALHVCKHAESAHIVLLTVNSNMIFEHFMNSCKYVL